MASSSASSSSHINRYDVFTSFHGPDVHKRFLSHLHTHFTSKGITTFNDQEIERGHTIGPELVQAIRESRVSIVVLSKKYAFSSWCLDELVEIFNCKEAFAQIVMTIFYEVDPSDVRKQRGIFGSAFEITCQGKSEKVKKRWRKALADVATIAGEHSLNWANEAEMIRKVATDVSKKLNVTPSRNLEGMVGLEAHLKKLESLLCLESDDVKMIGIWGPVGIGKSTIVRALYNQLSGSFQLRCFMGNLKGSYKSTMGVNDYDSKLSLQNQLLSKLLNQTDMRVYQLGVVEDWLRDQRVLIILDDVDDLEKLEFLAKELPWSGSGSRIIVTTEDKKILKAHGLNDIYPLDFPSKEEALEILCLSAFKQSFIPHGFEEIAKKVAKFCIDFPLGLCVVGSSLRGESKHEWELQLFRIETSLDRKIENIIRVGYDRLSKKDQTLFLHTACFFNNHDVNQVTSLLADSNLDVGNGLKTLAEKSLMHINGSIVMHYLLQQLGRQIVFEQSDDLGKRQFLVEVEEIHDVLANETGTRSVIGISLDMSKIGNDIKFSVGKKAFEGMHNLRFLRICRTNRSLSLFGGEATLQIQKGMKYLPRHLRFLRINRTNRSLSLHGGEATFQIPKGMKYLPRLRLLHWDSYPRKSLPPIFQPDRLVELVMQFSKLEKLWEGIEPLPNLKCIDLSFSYRLKEIPNISEATNLETLTLTCCSSLVELPSSIKNLQELKKLKMRSCKKLRLIPTNINLASLEEVDMSHCSQLASFPDFSMNIMELRVGSTKIEEVPSSIRNLHKLKKLKMDFCKKLRVIPTNIDLASLEEVDMRYCSRLRSFPDISSNIKKLSVKATKIKDVPPSVVRCWSRLECLEIGSRSWSRTKWLDIGCISLQRLTHVPLSVKKLDLIKSDIERIPDCVIGLPHLVDLIVENCPKLVSITDLPHLLESLNANECILLKKVCCSFRNQTKRLSFYNCLELDEESRRRIIKQSSHGYICLPGEEIPAEFTHKATGKSITIPLASGGEATFSASSRFKACFLVPPIKVYRHLNISCRLRSKGDLNTEYISRSAFLSDVSPRCHEVDGTISEITFDFSCIDDCDIAIKIIECGVQIMTEEAEGEGSSSSQVYNFDTRNSSNECGGNNTDEDNEAEGFRSWLRKLDLKRRGNYLINNRWRWRL